MFVAFSPFSFERYFPRFYLINQHGNCRVNNLRKRQPIFRIWASFVRSCICTEGLAPLFIFTFVITIACAPRFGAIAECYVVGITRCLSQLHLFCSWALPHHSGLSPEALFGCDDRGWHALMGLEPLNWVFNFSSKSRNC